MIYHIFDTPTGWTGIAGTEGRIAHLVLPNVCRDEVKTVLTARLHGNISEVQSDFSGAAESIASYFAGKRVNFHCEIDLGDAGAFDVDVWNAARKIGYGEVQTYSWIADEIGHPNAPRAVGQALGRNPVPIIIPCHRVIRSDGGLGGFSSGLHWKEKLLELERRW